MTLWLPARVLSGPRVVAALRTDSELSAGCYPARGQERTTRAGSGLAVHETLASHDLLRGLASRATRAANVALRKIFAVQSAREEQKFTALTEGHGARSRVLGGANAHTRRPAFYRSEGPERGCRGLGRP